MQSGNQAFINQLKDIVGGPQLLTGDRNTERYRKGFRSGEGRALAVAFPTSLLQLWRILQACVAADKIVIMQAANTGLTEGSTPSGNDYDRDIVIVSTLRLDHIQVLDNGKQVVGFPGSTLHHLEKLLKPYGREPHSVIGSSCIGASVIGGVCNNSGGSLVKRGPAYTEMALYAQLGEDGQLRLVNHLGIRLATRRKRSSPGWKKATIARQTSNTASCAPRITSTPAGCATSMPTPLPASTPTNAACTRPPAAPASWRCSRCGSTPSRKKAKSRCSISAPTTPRC